VFDIDAAAQNIREAACVTHDAPESVMFSFARIVDLTPVCIPAVGTLTHRF